MANCLTLAELEGLLSDSLPPTIKARAEAHCSGCQSCRQTLEAHRTSSASFDETKRATQRETIPGKIDSTVGYDAELAAFSGPPTVESIEGYHILSEIHRGGQGVVYKAVQNATKRTVALKFLLHGLRATDQQRHRFQREVDLAASLRHPNIVTIFDSGTTGEGSTYLVMEYIHGLPLDTYQAQHRLTTEQTLVLLHKVCGAVSYAHERGIVHRDLKPTNILVDADGEPHILDFGLAKGAGADVQGGRPVTVTGEFLGTLAYASPEQVARDPQRVDMRMDVYALGMTLYRLLTGEYAYPVQGHVGKVLQHIIQTEPQKPSLLRPELNRDIDTIVLKALAKEKDRRYSSAGALASDITCFLAGEPIQARRDHLLYVASKQATRWMARHEWTALFLVAVASVVLALGVGTPLVFRWTSVNQWYERAVVSRLMAAKSEWSFDHVRVIAMTDETDFEELARTQGLEGVRADQVKSWRRLHGKLMQRLVHSGARVVVWDITFRGETPFDKDFHRGVEALGEAGIPVVAAVRGWWFDESSLPELSRVIAPHVQWGCINAVFGPDSPWRVELTAQRGQHRPLPSLSLAAMALSRHPDADFEITIDAKRELVTIQYTRPHPELPQARMTIAEIDTLPTLFQAEEHDSPKFGLMTGDVVGSFLYAMPPDSVLARSTIEYASIFGASEDILHEWFEDRVVVVGDRRSEISDRYFHPDGRELPGCDGQASAIEQALDGVHRPTILSRATLRVSTVSGSVLFGLIVGLITARSPLRRYRALLVSAAVLTFASVLMAAGFQWIWNPMVPLLALLLSCELCSAVHRVRLRHASWIIEEISK